MSGKRSSAQFPGAQDELLVESGHREDQRTGHQTTGPQTAVPRVLGILNLTPDSFSDGGSYADAGGAVDVAAAVTRAHQIVDEGADVLDVGGESTRPGAAEVPVDVECARVIPVLEALGRDFPIPISVDTRRARVAAEAAACGARIVNDTSALRDDAELAAVVAAEELDLILMHRQGTPATMQDAPHYDDIVAEVRTFFVERVNAAIAAGIAAERLILDPGLGFGKKRDDNYLLLSSVPQYRIEQLPILIGASRKSFLDRFHPVPFAERLPGSLAFLGGAMQAGAEWVRVHDVAESVAFVRTFAALQVARTEVTSD